MFFIALAKQVDVDNDVVGADAAAPLILETFRYALATNGIFFN